VQDRSERRCSAPSQAHHRAVDVEAVLAAAGIAVEARRQDLERQGGREEQGIALQRRQDRLAQFRLQRRGVGQLLVVLDLGALGADRFTPIGPVRGVEGFAELRDLGRVEDLRDLHQHDGLGSPEKS
jgi:hypothetical protein